MGKVHTRFQSKTAQKPSPSPGRIVRRLKRIAILIFENILGRLTVFQSSFLMFVTFDHSLLKWNGW